MRSQATHHASVPDKPALKSTPKQSYHDKFYSRAVTHQPRTAISMAFHRKTITLLPNFYGTHDGSVPLKIPEARRAIDFTDAVAITIKKN